MRSFTRRPCNRAIRTKCDLINPALLVIGRKLAMFAVSINFNELAIVTACDDTRSVGHAGQNSACVGPNATFGFTREQKRLLAKHEYRCRAKEVHADDSRVDAYRADAVGQ